MENITEEQWKQVEDNLSLTLLILLVLVQVIIYVAVGQYLRRRDSDTVEVRLPGKGLRVLSRDARQLCRLASTIDLSRNEQLETVELHEAMGEWRGVRNLWLSHTGLSSVPSRSACWGNTLRVLWLYGNRLRELPPLAVGAWRLLTILDLSNNQLESIPEEIGQCARLEVLRLGRNRLSALPESLGQCEPLRQLLMEHNFLTALPASIGELRRLAVLCADHNRLERLPDSLGNCALEELALSHNQLSELPPDLALCPLRSVEVAHNALRSLPYPLVKRLQEGKMEDLALDGNVAVLDRASGTEGVVAGEDSRLCDVAAAALVDRCLYGEWGVTQLRGQGILAETWRSRRRRCARCFSPYAGDGYIRSEFSPIPQRAADMVVDVWVDARCCSLRCLRALPPLHS